MRLLFPLLLLALVGCGEDRSSGDYTSNETPSAEVPPRVGDVAGPEAVPSVVAGPNEAIRIEPAQVGVVTVSDAAGAYDVNLDQGMVIESIDSAPVDRAAVDAWLAQFAPLDGEATFEGVDPDEVQQDYTSLLTFLFTDGSARDVWLQRRDDGLAVLTRSGGRVFRLPASRYRDLVPEVEALRAQ